MIEFFNFSLHVQTTNVLQTLFYSHQERSYNVLVQNGLSLTVWWLRLDVML